MVVHTFNPSTQEAVEPCLLKKKKASIVILPITLVLGSQRRVSEAYREPSLAKQALDFMKTHVSER